MTRIFLAPILLPLSLAACMAAPDKQADDQAGEHSGERVDQPAGEQAAAPDEPAPPDASASPAPPPVSPPPPQTTASAGGTIIHDRAAADRLLGADGITLQWIDWDHRGPISVREEGGTIRISGSQQQADGPGKLFVEGEVVEIGTDYFVLDGVVRISDSPDPGRTCEADKTWHFAVTQNRPYWRLREFEWCDGLTDYVDIYF